MRVGGAARVSLLVCEVAGSMRVCAWKGGQAWIKGFVLLHTLAERQWAPFTWMLEARLRSQCTSRRY